MSAIVDPPIATFDLASESRTLYEQQRGVRRGFTFLSIVFIAALLWFIGITWSQVLVGGGWIILVVVIVACSAVIGEFLAIIWKWQRGAVHMEICEQGIVFTWHSGRTELLPWDVVSKDLVLRDSSQDGWTEPGSIDNWELRRWNRPVTRVPHEAFDAIIKTASSKGFTVINRTMEPRPWRWLGYRIIRFGSETKSR